MVRLVNQSLMTSSQELTAKQVQAAKATLSQAKKDNPLRRVRTSCCGWVRDPLARTGERVWCDAHADWTNVVEHAE
jgi:multidrug resistance efflux pump